MAFGAAAERDERRRMADLIVAIAHGYSGCRSKDGAAAMQRVLDALRK